MFGLSIGERKYESGIQYQPKVPEPETTPGIRSAEKYSQTARALGVSSCYKCGITTNLDNPLWHACLPGWEALHPIQSQLNGVNELAPGTTAAAQPPAQTGDRQPGLRPAAAEAA